MRTRTKFGEVVIYTKFQDIGCERPIPGESRMVGSPRFDSKFNLRVKQAATVNGVWN